MKEILKKKDNYIIILNEISLQINNKINENLNSS